MYQVMVSALGEIRIGEVGSSGGTERLCPHQIHMLKP